jgi:phospholipase A1
VKNHCNFLESFIMAFELIARLSKPLGESIFRVTHTQPSRPLGVAVPKTKNLRVNAGTVVVLMVGFVACSGTRANSCTTIEDDRQRLLCYDQEAGRKQPTAVIAPLPVEGPKPTAAAIAEQERKLERRTQSLVDTWDLDPAQVSPAFELRSHRPVFFLLGTRTNRINKQPSSPQAGHQQLTVLPLDPTESQFQLSFKSKVWDRVLGSSGHLWFGYTQSSRWQLFSGVTSRPFRETNYEPEAIFAMPTPYSIGDWRVALAGIGVNHQSNGRALPLSRSWNRVTGQIGIEKDGTVILLHPWRRLRESGKEDDNPSIEDYIGRGEVVVAQRNGGHVWSVQGRHSLRRGENSRGSVKIEWSWPIVGNLKGHLFVFSGYGESLIDYNHRQTMIGAGLSLVEWR